MYDIITIGGGPAGLTAALYGLRQGKSVLVLEKGTFGGQITFSPKVENIPGFVSLSGNEFAEKLVEQVLAQGAEVECAEALDIIDGDVKTVVTDCGNFEGKTVVVATGARHRLLGLENEEKFIGDGISFCAVCDGAFYKDKTVAVIGGGNSALQEALLLSEQCAKVYIVQNLDRLTGEERLVQKLEEKPNVEIILGTVVDKILGDDVFSGITALKTASGEKTDLALDGMFVAIGLIPQNEPFARLLTLDGRGYADSDERCLTSTPGIFVAGDCRKKQVRQLTTAAADGAVAALAACEYIERMQN